MSIARMRRVMAEADRAFADHPDVTLVGIGEKHTGGRNTRSYAVILGVESKGVAQGDSLPTSFRGIATDVIELPRKTMVMRNAELDGADLLIASETGLSGTLGFVARENGPPRRLFGITNAHVVAPTGEEARGTSITAFLDGETRVIGQVSHHTILHDDGRMNAPDVALIELNAKAAILAKAYRIEAWRNQPIKSVSSLSAAPEAGSRRPHEYASKATGLFQINRGRSPFEVTNLPLTAPDTGRPIYFRRAFAARFGRSIENGHSGSAITRLQTSGNSRALAGLVAGGRRRTLYAFAWRDIALTIKGDFGIEI